MSFYSYRILIRVLFHRERAIFLGCFWSMMIIILGIRVTIIISRVMDNLCITSDFQYRIIHLHIGYFVSIAIVESISSFFLLRTFLTAKKVSPIILRLSPDEKQRNLFQHLVRSTEIRAGSLCLVGITRAVHTRFRPRRRVQRVWRTGLIAFHIRLSVCFLF